MTLVEFIEAVGRVANKLVHLPDYFPELQSKNKYQLDKKIESFLMLLLHNCLPRGIALNLEKHVRKQVEEELALVKPPEDDSSDNGSSP